MKKYYIRKNNKKIHQLHDIELLDQGEAEHPHNIMIDSIERKLSINTR